MPIAAIPTEFNSGTIWLLVAYSIAIVLASVLGGWIPSLITLTHTRIQLIISCVGGMMLGVAVFHLLPHAVAEVGNESLHSVFNWLMVGLLFMFLLLRASHFHQHGPTDFGPEHGGHHCEEHAHLTVPRENTESPVNDDCLNANCELAAICQNQKASSSLRSDQPNNTSSNDAESPDHNSSSALGSDTSCGHDHTLTLRSRRIRFVAMLSGLALHTMLDGVAVAVAVQAESQHGEGEFSLLGFGVFLAVVLHKPLDAISITSLMQTEGKSRCAQLSVNFGFALMAPLGILLTLLGLLAQQGLGNEILAYAMAFSAGVFLCISLSDLLPEMQFHSHNRIRLTAALLLGVGIAWLAGILEPDHMHTHEHHHHHSKSNAVPAEH